MFNLFGDCIAKTRCTYAALLLEYFQQELVDKTGYAAPMFSGGLELVGADLRPQCKAGIDEVFCVLLSS